MSKKRIELCISLIALLAASTPSTVFAEGMNKSSKSITVVLSGPLQPYIYQNKDGKWIGLQAEALKYAADKMGYQINYKQMAFENELPALLSGRVDIGSGIYITPSRAKKIDYIPLVESYFGILTTKDFAKNIKNWSSFCGKDIAMHYSAPTESAIKKMNSKYCKTGNGAIPKPISGNIPDEIASVEHGRVAGAIDDVNMWRATVAFLPNLAVGLDKVGKRVYWPLAFKKGAKLRAKMLPWIEQFLNSPKATEVSLKYHMGQNVYVKGNVDELVREYLEQY